MPRVQLQRPFVPLDRLCRLSLPQQEVGQQEVGFPVVGLQVQRLVELGERRLDVALLHQCAGRFKVPPIVDGGGGNLLQLARLELDQLGQIDRTVVCRRVGNQDRRRVDSVLVDVGQEQLCEGSVDLRGEGQPATVRRPAVVRVHSVGVAVHQPRFAALGRNDVQLAVRPQQHPVSGLDEDDPLAIGGKAGKRVAHPVVRSTCNGLRRAALSVPERDAVEVVLDAGLARIVGVRRQRAVHEVRSGPCPCEHDGLLVRAPCGIGLDVLRIVGSGQGLDLPGLPVVDDQDPARGVKGLREPDIEVVGDEDLLVDHGDDIPAVRRDLREQAECVEVLRLAGVVVPRENVVLVEHHAGADVRQDVGALVAPGAIHVHAQRLPVRREGVTVGARRQMAQDDRSARLGEIAQAPLDERKHALGQGLDHSFPGRRGNHGHVAIEDHGSDRVV